MEKKSPGFKPGFFCSIIEAMSSEEIRQSFLDFFNSKGHSIVPSSSLIPDDPSVLLTTAGMQQFKRYFTGELDPMKDFGSKNTASVQKCFRTSDIEEVGDRTHLTFFEMLGNFSFGGPVKTGGHGASYWKKEAIHLAYEYITKVLGISPDRLTVTVFAGDKGSGSLRQAQGELSSPTNNVFPEQGRGRTIPWDKESFDIWHKEIGIPVDRIKKCGRADNFWGPTGNEGPCGPTTEIYADDVEIWNLVFNEYYCSPSTSSGGGSLRQAQGELSSPTNNVFPEQGRGITLKPLKTPGVDTGMGLERLVIMLQGVEDIFQTDLFAGLIKKINEVAPTLKDREVRVFADHLRSSIFLIADGVRPSNKEAGYILRRLLRRVIAYQTIYDAHADLFALAYAAVKEKYGKLYPEVNNPRILEVMDSEKEKFEIAIANGLKEIGKHKVIGTKEAFYLYESFGLPFELIKELAPEASKDLDRKEFDEAFKKHQELSRAGAEKKFGGHGLLLDTGELKAKDEVELKKVTRLHTATHLMQAALRKVLGPDVQQRGSDITAERTRFDFAFPRKLTAEEVKQVEDLVNGAVAQDLPMGFKEMAKEEAEKTGALYFFKQKYPERVKVYFAGHTLDDAFSKEFCGGPHVTHTLEVGKFKIMKEEAVGAGVRRIRATVE